MIPAAAATYVYPLLHGFARSHAFHYSCAAGDASKVCCTFFVQFRTQTDKYSHFDNLSVTRAKGITMLCDDGFFPYALDVQDISVMRQAVRTAADSLAIECPRERALLAAIVFGYYRRGLVDPDQLASVAIFAASSRVFRSEFRRVVHATAVLP